MDDATNRWKDPEQHARQATVVARSRMWEKSPRTRPRAKSTGHELLAAALATLVPKVKA